MLCRKQVLLQHLLLWKCPRQDPRLRAAEPRQNAEFYRAFTKERIKRNIQLNVLAVESVRGTEFSKTPFAHFRYLPKGFESPLVIWIFGEYIAHVLWHKPQTIFLIQDKNIADTYRQYYDVLSALSRG